jgi:hypothetical protein
MRLLSYGVMDKQSFKIINPQRTTTAVKLFEDFFQHCLTLLDCEEGTLLRVHEDCDDDLIEEFAAAFDNVEVTVRDGVKRTGVDGSAHGLEW